jgi:nitroimidazol reductase NimA-like FMN-containing flavoprotein (pyridoxamine 5'-phosphate oxidase superfamily)
VRRKDKEITDRQAIDAVIAGCQVLRLALAREGEPYLVPLSFGYDGRAFYLHTALTGRKLEFFQPGARVCFELEREVVLRPHPTDPCEWTFSFQSVIGYGTLAELEGETEKQDALVKIMRQYQPGDYRFPPAALKGIRVWKIEVESISGKQSKDNF